MTFVKTFRDFLERDTLSHKQQDKIEKVYQSS